VGQALPPLRPLGARSPSNLQDARTPSPNYFGLTIDAAKDCLSTGGGENPRANWSPATSNVRSAAAASPRVIPLDQNPEFDAFRRQSEQHGFTSGRLSSFQMGMPPNPRKSSYPISPSAGLLSPTKNAGQSSPRTSIPTVETKFAETKQTSPKRLLSSPAPHITDRPRRHSPAGFTDREEREAPQAIHFLAQGKDVQFSLPPTETNPPLPPPTLHNRADTLPASLGDQVGGDGKSGGPALISPQQVVDILRSSEGEVLILDVRVSTQYSKARVAGALNLCIPTTLLKRVSYDTLKLAETFKIPEQRQKFERWRDCQFIVVYDANSSKIKDATPCVKMLEKFAKEGFTGASYIVRGGFADLSMRFLDLVDQGPEDGAFSPQSALSPSHGNALPAVIGGCPMPVTENAANPFFGNIRQNMDLIGGVGQMAVQRPASMSHQVEEGLPLWLKTAVNPKDDGKTISDTFLQIEKNEQKRMQRALSDNVSYGTPRPEAEKPVQLAGIEKGQKNRYNNIWPFEHSRVKLQGVSSGGCDYFNANHIKADWSNKRYIATQGPIPATFNVSLSFTPLYKNYG
jgi:tyrosine-protein phosphatase 2/3